MFANRFTALVDACSLVDVLGRNTLLSLAHADLYRLRWSEDILSETEGALAKVFNSKGIADPDAQAARQINRIRDAFPSAMIAGFESLIPANEQLPDPKDGHVIGAATAAKASVLITENIKDFPDQLMRPRDIEIKTSDDFIADAIALEPVAAIAALEKMRVRFNKPELTPSQLLLKYEASGFIATADQLRAHWVGI